MSSNIYSITITTSSYTNPRVNSASVSATSQYIYLEVSATDGTNPIDEYCYSINGGSYSCRSYDFFEFSGLSENVTYNIRIYAVDTEGYKSDVYTTSATTRYIAPVITSLYVSTYTNLAYASIYVDLWIPLYIDSIEVIDGVYKITDSNYIDKLKNRIYLYKEKDMQKYELIIENIKKLFGGIV